MMRRQRRIAAPCAAFALLFGAASAQTPVDYAALQVTTTDLGNGVHLLNWRGGDSLFLVGEDGVLLVDTSVAAMGDKIVAAIRAVTPKPVTVVVNTHAHADHFGANEQMAKGGALIVGHDLLRARMEKGQYLASFRQTIPPSPAIALPTITFADSLTLHFGGETIHLIHVPNAHTDNDALVHFERARVIHASGTIGGDGGYPFFDLSSNGSLAGTIAAEDRMLALADAGTRIIADEGAPASRAMLQASRDALVTLRTRVQVLVDEGRTEEQAIAAKPTRDLDAQFAPRGGFLSGDAITRLAYQSLKGIRPPEKP